MTCYIHNSVTVTVCSGGHISICSQQVSVLENGVSKGGGRPKRGNTFPRVLAVTPVILCCTVHTIGYSQMCMLRCTCAVMEEWQVTKIATKAFALAESALWILHCI